jgi:hypothetical protein
VSRIQGACAYCQKRRAVNRDHVVPRSLVKRLKGRPLRSDIPEELLVTVPACLFCNTGKGTRRLVPPSWADRVALLNELIPGKPWRVWDGDTKSPAYREVWL